MKFELEVQDSGCFVSGFQKDSALTCATLCVIADVYRVGSEGIWGFTIFKIHLRGYGGVLLDIRLGLLFESKLFSFW
jgi:hypothetical protein